MLPGRRTSATAVADGQVIEWSPPRTIGIAPVCSDLVDLAVDQGVGPLDPGGHDVRVAGIDDSSTSNGSTPSWREWIEPDVYCASRIARGPKRAPGPVADGVVERRTDDRHVDRAGGRSSAGSVTQGSFMNVVGPT